MWSSFLVILEASSSEFIVFVIKGIVILELRYIYILFLNTEFYETWETVYSFIYFYQPRLQVFRFRFFFSSFFPISPSRPEAPLVTPALKHNNCTASVASDRTREGAQSGKQAWTATATGGDSEHRGRGERGWKWELSSTAQRLCLFFIHSFVLPADGEIRPGASTDSSKVHLHVSWIIHVFLLKRGQHHAEAEFTRSSEEQPHPTPSALWINMVFCIWIIDIYIWEYILFACK